MTLYEIKRWRWAENQALALWSELFGRARTLAWRQAWHDTREESLGNQTLSHQGQGAPDVEITSQWQQTVVRLKMLNPNI